MAIVVVAPICRPRSEMLPIDGGAAMEVPVMPATASMNASRIARELGMDAR
jgi:hypothetical protein